jgi:hypothetical protein
MQEKLKAWVAGMGVTGGILAPMKCWWYLVNIKYKLGWWRADTPSGETALWMKNHGQDPIIIQRMHTLTGMNMLGVYLAPDGNVTDHVQYLRRKAESWASNMKQSQGLPFAMCYSLQATAFSKEDCRYVMAPIYKTGLPLASIAATTPTVIRMSSINSGGFGMIDPYLHMRISQIEMLITHLWTGTPTGKLLAISIDDITLEMGLSTLWTPDAIRNGLLYANTHSWICHVLQFTLDLNISLHLEGVLFPRHRAHDRTIMQSALQYTNKMPHLRAINSVHMALNVIWLSEISNATGTCIDRVWFKMPDYIPLRNHYRWPSMHHITSTDWCRWRRFLGALC